MNADEWRSKERSGYCCYCGGRVPEEMPVHGVTRINRRDPGVIMDLAVKVHVLDPPGGELCYNCFGQSIIIGGTDIMRKMAAAHLRFTGRCESCRAATPDDRLAWFKEVAQKLSLGVMVERSDGTVLWVNEYYTRLTGYTTQDIYGKRPGDFLLGELSDMATVKRIREARETRTLFEGRVNNYTKDRHPYGLQLAAAPVVDERGDLLFRVSLFSAVPLVRSSEEGHERDETLRQLLTVITMPPPLVLLEEAA